MAINNSKRPVLTVALSVLLFTSSSLGLASSQSKAQAKQRAGTASQMSDMNETAYDQMNKAMQKMMSDMESMPMMSTTDENFAHMMMIHHQGAIDMARAELEHGSDPQMKAMAQKTIRDQGKEIQKLQEFLNSKSSMDH